jgi:hypothetical protein
VDVTVGSALDIFGGNFFFFRLTWVFGQVCVHLD